MVTLPNGTTVLDESGGFVVLDFSIPSTMIGATGNSKIRFVVNTDSSVQYGSPNDAREGLTVDWFKVINSSGATSTAIYSLIHLLLLTMELMGPLMIGHSFKLERVALPSQTA